MIQNGSEMPQNTTQLSANTTNLTQTDSERSKITQLHQLDQKTLTLIKTVSNVPKMDTKWSKWARKYLKWALKSLKLHQNWTNRGILQNTINVIATVSRATLLLPRARKV